MVQHQHNRLLDHLRACHPLPAKQQVGSDRRGGAIGVTAAGCAHPGSAAFAVPDLIEEIAVSTVHDGGQVQAVPDPPGGIAAWLRFPLRRGNRT